MSDEKDKRRDDFWDVDKLVPKKKPLKPFSTRPTMVDYGVQESPRRPNEYDNDRLKLTYSNATPAITTADDEVYSPAWSPFITAVKIKRRRDRYDFYDGFRKAAMLNYNIEGKRCDYTQFYSFMPQFSQLSASQRDYYFYWRSEVRAGRYQRTDYSYLYLLIYEIFNLPDLIPPDSGIKLIVKLWREYRRALPRIDLYFPIWVQDYCLVHKLVCPINEISDFIYDILTTAPLREFYLCDWENAGERGVLGLMAYLSDYDYRKGKYADGNPDADKEKRERQAEIYKTHMSNAFRLILKEGEAISADKLRSGELSRICREAFPNSVCTHSVKCTLEIEYHSLTDMSDLRAGITAAMRYAENRMRGIMGIKSRLAVKGLPDKYKNILEPYFNVLEKRERALSAKVEIPEYEKLYSAPREKLSSASADMIENVSWTTTARLVSEFESSQADEATEDARDPSLPESIVSSDASLELESSENSSLDREAIDFLSYVCNFELAPGYKHPRGFEADVIAERINAEFYESLGDIVLEKNSDSYCIIEDYMEDVKEWLSKAIR